MPYSAPSLVNPRGSNFSGSSSLCEFSPFTSIKRHSCLVAPFVPSVLTLYRMVLPSGETATARALHSARAVAVSPDGKTILYNVSTDGTKGATKHEWRLIDVNGENSHKLELPEKFEPRGFTRDGALYGIYEVEKLGQLAIVPLAAAKPTIILALPNGAHGATISPDGRRFALLADSRAKDPLEGVHTVVENDQTSLYVVGADGIGGAWWCPDLNVITDIAWSRIFGKS